MQSTSGNHAGPSQSKVLPRACRFAVRFISGVLFFAMVARPTASAASGLPMATPPQNYFAAFLQSVTRAQLSQYSPLLAELDRINSGVLTPMIGQSVPMFMSLTPQNAIGGIDKISVTISVSQAGDCVQLGTDCPWLLNSPSCSWPYNVAFPLGGSNTRTVTLSTNPVSASQGVKIYACRSGVDASNPANWSVVQTVTILPLK